MTAAERPIALAASSVPEPVKGLLAQLAASGHGAYLVGGCVRDLLRGQRVADFDVATSAPPEAVLRLFPRAVPIGLRHGTVMVPTGAGPVDVTSFRAGPRLEDDLARRDFTVNALGWEPRTGRVLDPFGGVRDLRAGRLRAVVSPDARLSEDPLRALRAARLVACLGLQPEPGLEQAMARARERLAGVARERIQRELAALLLAPGAATGLALLRRCGIEAVLAEGTAPDAAAVVGALPPELSLRLAGWLRGTDAGPILARLRFSRRIVERVSRLVSLHPIDRAADPSNRVEVRRLIRRAGSDNLEALFVLREAELRVAGDAASARRRLESLRRTLEQLRQAGTLALRRRDLALNGRDLMRLLGWGPGPWVGAALHYLTEKVIEEPAANTPERLRALMQNWRPPGSQPAPDPVPVPVAPARGDARDD